MITALFIIAALFCLFALWLIVGNKTTEAHQANAEAAKVWVMVAGLLVYVALHLK